MKIFLDDEREAPDGWYLVRDANEALMLILSGNVEIISLDHDLGNDPYTGYWLLNRIEERIAAGETIETKFVVHSANPVGRQNMQRAIVSIERLR